MAQAFDSVREKEVIFVFSLMRVFCRNVCFGIRSVIGCFDFFMNIIVIATKTDADWNFRDVIITLVTPWNMTRELFSINGIDRNWWKSWWQMKVAFPSSSLTVSIYRYPLLSTTTAKMQVEPSISIHLFIHECTNDFLIVTDFKLSINSMEPYGDLFLCKKIFIAANPIITVTFNYSERTLCISIITTFFAVAFVISIAKALY